MKIKVRWFDGYIEEFNVKEWRNGNAYLWMHLVNGEERWIPLIQVRWFGPYQ